MGAACGTPYREAVEIKGARGGRGHRLGQESLLGGARSSEGELSSAESPKAAQPSAPSARREEAASSTEGSRQGWSGSRGSKPPHDEEEEAAAEVEEEVEDMGTACAPAAAPVALFFVQEEGATEGASGLPSVELLRAPKPQPLPEGEADLLACLPGLALMWLCEALGCAQCALLLGGGSRWLGWASGCAALLHLAPASLLLAVYAADTRRRQRREAAAGGLMAASTREPLPGGPLITRCAALPLLGGALLDCAALLCGPLLPLARRRRGRAPLAHASPGGSARGSDGACAQPLAAVLAAYSHARLIAHAVTSAPCQAAVQAAALCGPRLPAAARGCSAALLCLCAGCVAAHALPGAWRARECFPLRVWAALSMGGGLPLALLAEERAAALKLPCLPSGFPLELLLRRLRANRSVATLTLRGAVLAAIGPDGDAPAAAGSPRAAECGSVECASLRRGEACAGALLGVALAHGRPRLTRLCVRGAALDGRAESLALCAALEGAARACPKLKALGIGLSANSLHPEAAAALAEAAGRLGVRTLCDLPSRAAVAPRGAVRAPAAGDLAVALNLGGAEEEEGQEEEPLGAMSLALPPDDATDSAPPAPGSVASVCASDGALLGWELGVRPQPIEALLLRVAAPGRAARSPGLGASGALRLCAGLRAQPALRQLLLAGCGLTDAGGALLCAAAAHAPRLRDLALTECGLGDESARAATALLRPGSALARLDLSGNPALRTAGARALAAALAVGGCGLRALALDGCAPGERGAAALGGALGSARALVRLSLAACALPDGAGLALAAGAGGGAALTALDLSANALGARSAEAFGSALRGGGCVLRALQLRGNGRIGDEGAAALSEGLRGCGGLRALGLAGCGVSAWGAAALASAASSRACGLRHLQLCDNPRLRDAGASALARALCGAARLRSLGLAGCALGEAGAAALAAALESSRSLAELGLSRNPAIGSAGAIALARALRRNARLRLLLLDGCGLEAVCVEAWADALESNGALCQLSLRRNLLPEASRGLLAAAWASSRRDVQLLLL